MYKQEVLGLEEACRAVRACVEKAAKEPLRPIAVAVVDNAGCLICFQRMDGNGISSGKLTTRMAYNKAYTAVMFNRSTQEFKARLKELAVEVGVWGDPALTTIPGGLVWKNKEGQALGAIGVSGRLAHEDEELAHAGLDAVKI